MTTESGIRLEFAQFGHFTSFDVIRSMVSMASVADADLPTPIATGLKTMYYVDTAVVEGAVYYYRVRVWRDGVSLVSEEIKVSAVVTNDDFSEYVTLYMPLISDYIPKVGETTVTISGSNCKFKASGGPTSAGYFEAGAGSFLDMPLASFFNNVPFCIDFYALTSGEGFDGVASFGATKSTDHANFTLTANSWWVSKANNGWTLSALPNYWSTNVWAHHAICWDGDKTLRIFRDGIKVYENTNYTAPITQTKNLMTIGKKSDGLEHNAVNGFQHLRITRGHQRYTGNFIPQTDYFY